MLLVEVFEVGDAPAATGAGSEALGDERGDLWIFAFEVVLDFSQRDTKAEADMVGWLHFLAPRWLSIVRMLAQRGLLVGCDGFDWARSDGLAPIVVGQIKERAWSFCLH